MALKLQNISAEAFQRHSIIFREAEIILTLRFYPRSQIWCMDLSYLDWEVNGIKLSTGVLHIAGQNKQFDFIVRDLSNNGLDPFKKTDFEEGRCEIYMLEQLDIEEIRGIDIL